MLHTFAVTLLCFAAAHHESGAANDPPELQSSAPVQIASLGTARDQRREASSLREQGRTEEAIALLDSIVAPQSTAGAFDRAEAYRMRAQLRLALTGQPASVEAAKADFRRALDLFGSPELERYGLSYASCVMQLAELLISQRRLDEALAINDRLLRPDLVKFHAAALDRRSRILERQGDFTAATDALSDALVIDPQYGLAFGRYAQVRYRLADLRGRGESAAESVARWSELLRDPQMESDPFVIEIHRRLIHSLQTSGQTAQAAEACRQLVLCIERSESNWLQLPSSPITARHLRRAEETALSIMSSDSSGHTDEAVLWALDRLIASATDNRIRQTYQLQRDAAWHRIVKRAAAVQR